MPTFERGNVVVTFEDDGCWIEMFDENGAEQEDRTLKCDLCKKYDLTKINY